MTRLWWLLRLAFHDWMWEGRKWNSDPADPDWPRRRGRKLPLYFSDPHALPWKNSTLTPVEIVTPPEGIRWIKEPQTWGATGSANYTATWPLSPENPYQ